MAIRLKRPSPATLAGLRTEGGAAALTYAPVGLSSMTTTPAGYRLDRWTREVAAGDAFDAAVAALFHSGIHRGAGLIVCADGAAEIGMVVAMAAPSPIGFIEVVCRVVEVATSADRVGFTYGTLPVHPEQGEESFSVARRGNNVVFEIVAFSRPRHPLARACPRAARALQRAATIRYLDAMQSTLTSRPQRVNRHQPL